MMYGLNRGKQRVQQKNQDEKKKYLNKIYKFMKKARNHLRTSKISKDKRKMDFQLQNYIINMTLYKYWLYINII